MELPPTESLYTLEQWSRTFNWQERATLYDAQREEEKTLRRKEVMENGLALDFERVSKLQRLADFLEGQMYERGEGGVYHNIWMPDVKSVGSGEFAERVDLEKFNAAIIEQYRKALEDIAKETGGRLPKSEYAWLGDILPLLPTDALKRIADGENPISVLTDTLTSLLATAREGGAATEE